MMITKSGKYPGRCLQLYDYLCQEETQMELIYGIEGKSWDYDKNGYPVVYPDIDAMEDDQKKGVYGVEAYWLFRSSDITATYEKYGASEEKIKSFDITGKYYKDLTFFAGAESYSADSEEIKIFTNVKEYYEVQVMKLITCKPDELEGLYQEMMQTIDGMGQETLNQGIDEYFQNKDQTIQKYSEGLGK